MSRIPPIAAVLAIALLAFAGSATADEGKGKGKKDDRDDRDKRGFLTETKAMLKPVAGRSTVKPIISVGDRVRGGFVFEAIPDGISIARKSKKSVDILLNHELSLVPFPLANPTATPPVVGRTDFQNALVSRLSLSGKNASVLDAEYVIESDSGYQRFCSNFVVGHEHGFERRLLFTNEEARDIVRRQEQSWAPDLTLFTDPNAEQAGVVVAFDVKSGEHRPIYGMGRHNHENSVGVPGYGHPVVLSGDDTFDAPASQLYLYTAKNGKALWNDRGRLHAFKSDNEAINDYGDITVGGAVAGTFIPVPRVIATGKGPDGNDITSKDFPMPGVFDQAVPAPTGAIPDGPQWVLEYWSNFNNVFQFIRIEDTAYDRLQHNVMYLADTGEPRAEPEPAPGTRLRRGASSVMGNFMNGRLFKLVLDPNNPLKGTLSIMPNADFDAGGYNNLRVPHQPDNVETIPGAILFQEDPGSHNAQPRFPGASNARIWRYDLKTGALSVVAEVNQAVGPTTNRGVWESSGIVDVSKFFGKGTFLVDVQAHTWEIASEPSTVPNTFKRREAGQLLLLKVHDDGDHDDD